MQTRFATSEDVIGIVYVQATTWIAHYPSPEHGISEEDVRQIDWQAKIPGWQHMIMSSKYEVRVAAEDGYVYGFVATSIHERVLYVYDLYVLPDYQKQGLGTALLEAALAGTELEACLQVADYNHKARRFYEQFGFEETDARGLYVLPNEKAIPTVYLRRRSKQTPPATDRLLNRTQLAERLGLRPSTIKWYSELGLLPFRQDESGRRRYYDPAAVEERLELIRKQQQAGRTLPEIANDF